MEALLKVVAMVHHMVEVAEHSKDAQRDHSGHTKQLSLLHTHTLTLCKHRKLHSTAIAAR
jgi:hypothetical protein